MNNNQENKSFKMTKNASAMTYAKSGLGGGVVALIFGESMLGSLGLLLALISGITAIVKNKEKDRNVRGTAILGFILVILSFAIRSFLTQQ